MNCKHTVRPGSASFTVTLKAMTYVCSFCEMERLQTRVDELEAMLNTPRTDDFFEAVRNEAAHQIDRWGIEHDAGKRREDWIALIAYLLGKATKAHYDVDSDKLKHHVVTIAAVCLNWLRAENGESTAMRPGIAEAEGGGRG